MEQIHQNNEINLIQTKKTVEWLTDNTDVRVFNPISFEGYQRKIDDKHCMKIVEFLQKDFFLPTSVICAISENFTEASRLRIVDGQHRIQALKIIKKSFPERYKEIKNKELPIIVMSKVSESIEIDTFITINKTSKKVDTSLAFVLKNKMNKYASSDDLTMPKAEYLAVELAQKLNFEENCSLWFDKIIFEGTPKNTPQLISLNAFVKSTRSLLNNLAKRKLIVLDWNDNDDINACIDKCYGFILKIWCAVAKKWTDLFLGSLENRRIIQGAIGYSSINRVVIDILSQEEFKSLDDLGEKFQSAIESIKIESSKWLPSGEFSRYSSESGYSIVAKELRNAMY